MKQSSMTSDEHLVWHALSACEGKSHAVTQHELAEHCRMESRQVRRVIELLIYKHRKPIASSPQNIGGGYYLVKDQQEAKEAAQRYKNQAAKIYRRAAVLLQISEKDLYSQIQKELDFDS